jgi:hypothetical protein
MDHQRSRSGRESDRGSTPVESLHATGERQLQREQQLSSNSGRRSRVAVGDATVTSPRARDRTSPSADEQERLDNKAAKPQSSHPMQREGVHLLARRAARLADINRAAKEKPRR